MPASSHYFKKIFNSDGSEDLFIVSLREIIHYAGEEGVEDYIKREGVEPYKKYSFNSFQETVKLASGENYDSKRAVLELIKSSGVLAEISSANFHPNSRMDTQRSLANILMACAVIASEQGFNLHDIAADAIKDVSKG